MDHYSFLQIEDFNRADFLKYLANFADSNWNRRTLEQKIKILCIFGNWLCDNRLTERHHRPRFSRKPVQRDLPESFELDLLFDTVQSNYLDSSGKTRRINFQRYLILRLLYFTGGRISEILNLYLEDIRIQSGKYFCLIRGTKSEAAERAVEIPAELFEQLNEYRNIYDLKGRIFTNTHNRAYSPIVFCKWLKAFAESLKISCKVHPHLFRYLFIIESIKRGEDLTELMVRLGHSDVSMTIYYFNQVRRLYPDIALSNSISILERKKNLNAHIYNQKP